MQVFHTEHVDVHLSSIIPGSVVICKIQHIIAVTKVEK